MTRAPGRAHCRVRLCEPAREPSGGTVVSARRRIMRAGDARAGRTDLPKRESEAAGSAIRTTPSQRRFAQVLYEGTLYQPDMSLI